MSQDTETETWTAVNQFNKEEYIVQLPKVRIGKDFAAKECQFRKP